MIPRCNHRFVAFIILRIRPRRGISAQLCLTVHLDFDIDILSNVDPILRIPPTFRVDPAKLVRGPSPEAVATGRENVGQDLLYERAKRRQARTQDAAVQLDNGPIRRGGIIPERVRGVDCLVQRRDPDDGDDAGATSRELRFSKCFHAKDQQLTRNQGRRGPIAAVSVGDASEA